jgi:general secretion pathway protein A
VYLKHFNLAREPFGVTPDPDFLYLSPTHREALAAVVYGIRERKGFISVTGEVGTGKTTILRSALQHLRADREKPIYIFHPNVSFKELLKNIFYELGVENVPQQPDDMVRRLHEILIEEYAAGRNLFLVIDEAQNMPIKTMESLRMLSNIETTKDKLLQIVLVGQPELDRKLARYELRQLRQRIAVRAVIKPLSAEESVDYIKHRLIKAGAPRVWIFTEGAKKMIIDNARGNPRLMNIICDNALVTGFGYQKKVITSVMVEEVVQDLLLNRALEMPGPGETLPDEVTEEADPGAILSNASPEVKREALRLLLDFINETRIQGIDADGAARPAAPNQIAMGQAGAARFTHRPSEND